MKKTSYIIFLSIISLAFISCGETIEDKKEPRGKRIVDTNNFPQSVRDERRADRGSVTGGFALFGGDDDKPAQASSAGVMGVNSYLWRASLDVISFMPLASVDTRGGVIITDWYEAPQAPNERLKSNILISSDEFKPSALKVSLFRQVMKGGAWRDVPVSGQLVKKFEDKILSKARDIKIAEERN